MACACLGTLSLSSIASRVWASFSRVDSMSDRISPSCRSLWLRFESSAVILPHSLEGPDVVLHALDGFLRHGRNALLDLAQAEERECTGDEEQQDGHDEGREPRGQHEGQRQDHGGDEHSEAEEPEEGGACEEACTHSELRELLGELFLDLLDLVPDQLPDEAGEVADQLDQRLLAAPLVARGNRDGAAHAVVGRSSPADVSAEVADVPAVDEV